MAGGVDRFTDLRAWRACDVYKKAVYRVCERPPLAHDWKRRGQLEEAVRGPGAHIAEGFGRFSPPDFARFAVMARASLMESQNHLFDLVDCGHIDEQQRLALNGLAETALQEVTGLLEYLQSPEALRNARRARERRIASRSQRRTPNSDPSHSDPSHSEPPHSEPSNPEPPNSEPPNSEPEQMNPERRTKHRT